MSEDVHLDAKILTEVGKEFDINSFTAMETEAIDALDDQNKDTMSPIKVGHIGDIYVYSKIKWKPNKPKKYVNKFLGACNTFNC